MNELRRAAQAVVNIDWGVPLWPHHEKAINGLRAALAAPDDMAEAVRLIRELQYGPAPELRRRSCEFLKRVEGGK